MSFRKNNSLGWGIGLLCLVIAVVIVGLIAIFTVIWLNKQQDKKHKQHVNESSVESASVSQVSDSKFIEVLERISSRLADPQTFISTTIIIILMGTNLIELLPFLNRPNDQKKRSPCPGRVYLTRTRNYNFISTRVYFDHLLNFYP